MMTQLIQKIFTAAAGFYDGPGVQRQITPRSVLERDVRLAGKLQPPRGVTVKTNADGVRIMSVNIHMGVPDGLSLNPQHENIEALRDVARFINETNPDVVLVQEVRNRPVLSGADGISDVASVFAHLIDATQKAFTPAVTGDPKVNNLSHYGTAIYTRNGFKIDRAVNISLPNSSEGREPRSAGIAAISSPDGSQQLTVISTHLAHLPEEDRELRAEQLRTLSVIAESIRTTGSFIYRAALGAKLHRARYFPRRIALGGDLNQTQPATDAVLNGAGLTHVNTLLAKLGGEKAERALVADAATTCMLPDGNLHRIDHLYGSGIEVADVVVEAVPSHEYVAGAPTDHKTLIADVAAKKIMKRFKHRL